MMREQILTLKADRPVVIETPEGLVRIFRCGRSRKLRIELPPAMRAYQGDERAIEHLRFLRMGEDGEVKPGYNTLRPITDENGKLVRVEALTAVKLAPTSDRTATEQPIRRARLRLAANG